MLRAISGNGTSSPRAVSRRDFLILAAAGLLAGCRPTPQATTLPTTQPTAQPTTQPTAQPTVQPTAPNPTPVSKMIACCGLICTDCPAFLATQADDDEARQTIAARWSAHYGMEFKPEDINCDGCLSEGGRLSGYCRNLCQVRPCAQEREVENCAYCDDYACEKLSDFLAQVPQAKATLERIRKSIGQ